jgi:hypothetical protein
MIEGILSWVMLFIGMGTTNANYFIASGVFAVASHLYQMRKGGEG